MSTPIPEKPAVSVLMTVYNGGRFLAAALESLLAQTFSDFEAVIVDDGSTDYTAKILSEYTEKDSRIKVHHQKKTGRSQSLNAAFHFSQGEYIAIMDADDVSLPERLGTNLDYLKTHPEIAMVGSFYEQIDAHDHSIKTVDNIPTRPTEIGTTLEKENPICHGTVMIRREAMQEAGLYREAFSAAVDYDLYLRVLDRHAIAIIPEVLYRYRVHGQSISSRRLMQLQLKGLAQKLQAERKLSGKDVLQALEPAGQRAYIDAFLKEDLRENRRNYSEKLFEMARKYEKSGESAMAASLFMEAFRLNPANFRAFRYYCAMPFKSKLKA